MAKFFFIRHGEADYAPCLDRSFIGLGIEMAQLTQKGIEQIKAASLDSRLLDAEVIISSPFTRALQSASIIADKINKDIQIEIDVREWCPDTSYLYKNDHEINALHNDFEFHKGIYPIGETKLWEDCKSVKKRALAVLEKYKHFEKVVIVCHGYLISMTTSEIYENIIENGEIVEFIYH